MAPNAESAFPASSLPVQNARPKRALVGVDGQWYDVTTLLDHHPGGPIIKSYVGRDATEVFRAFHTKEALGKRIPVGTYDPVAQKLSQSKDVTREEIEAYAKIQVDFKALEEKFRNEGWYDDNIWWLARQCIFCATLFSFVLFGVLYCIPTFDSLVVAPLVSGVLLAAFWQQCGFLMHDFMHSNVFQDRALDQRWGVWFGTICLGIPSRWWKDEHDIHHSLTNTFTEDENSQDFDIQMLQKMWTQDKQLLQFSNGECKSNAKFPSLPRWFTIGLIKIQHLTFIPLCVFLGRFGIILDSYNHEPRQHEWHAIRVHWAWVIFLLSMFPTSESAAIFYVTAAICQGILHIQLLISHFAEPFEESKESLAKGFFAVHQTVTCSNIINPWYTDWFYGGLNFHIEHHLFPRLPRQKLRHAAPLVRDFCAKHGLEYKEDSFVGLLDKVITHLKDVGTLVEIPDIRH